MLKFSKKYVRVVCGTDLWFDGLERMNQGVVINELLLKYTKKMHESKKKVIRKKQKIKCKG